MFSKHDSYCFNNSFAFAMAASVSTEPLSMRATSIILSWSFKRDMLETAVDAAPSIVFVTT